jgi:hypothetical protein
MAISSRYVHPSEELVLAVVVGSDRLESAIAVAQQHAQPWAARAVDAEAAICHEEVRLSMPPVLATIMSGLPFAIHIRDRHGIGKRRTRVIGHYRLKGSVPIA